MRPIHAILLLPCAELQAHTAEHTAQRHRCSPVLQAWCLEQGDKMIQSWLSARPEGEYEK